MAARGDNLVVFVSVDVEVLFESAEESMHLVDPSRGRCTERSTCPLPPWASVVFEKDLIGADVLDPRQQVAVLARVAVYLEHVHACHPRKLFVCLRIEIVRVELQEFRQLAAECRALFDQRAIEAPSSPGLSKSSKVLRIVKLHGNL